MAIPWVSLLKTVPWSDVINSAPAIADGAKRLWKAVARMPPANDEVMPDAAADPASPASATADAPPWAHLQHQVEGLQALLDEQHRQMLASTELIKDLADQNAELIKRIEVQRGQLRWLAAGLALAAILAATALVLALRA